MIEKCYCYSGIILNCVVPYPFNHFIIRLDNKKIIDLISSCIDNRHNAPALYSFVLLTNKLQDLHPEQMIIRLKIKDFLLYLIFLFVIIFTKNSNAQQASKVKKLRHKFAESTIGLSLENHFSGQTFIFNESDQIQKQDFQHFAIPKIHLGGLHFWGHTEIYFAFSLLRAENKYNHAKYEYSFNDVFGINFYPWSVKEKKLRPYVGISLSGINYEHISDNEQNKGSLSESIVYPLALGLSYRVNRSHLIGFDFRYNYKNKNTYYLGVDDPVDIEYPQYVYSLTYKYIRESTRSAEKDFYNGTTQRQYEQLKKEGKLGSIFFGVGPSSAFLTKSSSHLDQTYPYISRPVTTNVFLDLSAGYYFENSKLHAELSFRQNKKAISAHGTEIEMHRKSLLLCVHRQLFDYQGFVPFIGVGGGFDWLNYKESSLQGAQIDLNKRQVSFAFVTGWDILPDKLQFITLRTNIRYFPQLNIENISNNNHISFNQIEFNFIQVVFYPGRWKNMRNIN